MTNISLPGEAPSFDDRDPTSILAEAVGFEPTVPV